MRIFFLTQTLKNFPCFCNWCSTCLCAAMKVCVHILKNYWQETATLGWTSRPLLSSPLTSFLPSSHNIHLPFPLPSLPLSHFTSRLSSLYIFSSLYHTPSPSPSLHPQNHFSLYYPYILFLTFTTYYVLFIEAYKSPIVPTDAGWI